MPRADVLLVSLGGTAGLREADAELAASLRRAGAEVAEAHAAPPREWRTYALLELAWARAARAAARAGIDEHRPRAVLYSSTTAALLAPRPGAIRFDAPAAGNRPGRHGIWQRPVERRRMRDATLLVPWSDGGLAEAPHPRADAVVVPVPVAASGPPAERDITAITYAANPEKKGLDRVLAAWQAARRPGEELVVAGLDEAAWRRAGAPGGTTPTGTTPGGTTSGGKLPGGTTPGGGSSWAGTSGGGAPEGVRFAGLLPRAEYRALLRRARVFVCAPRREDYGISQLEALADGAMLVTAPSPGPYAALPLARELDPRLVGGVAEGIRTALEDPSPGYAERAAALLAPWRPEAVDRVVAEDLLPRLVSRP
jgi:glycosyltransferase involved in cell wall biosynthesis